MENQAQPGTIEWIGLRPGKRVALQSVQTAELSSTEGLIGDHYQGRSGNRHVTLIQAEHVEAVGSMLGKKVYPTETRRNIVVKGVNLLSFKDRRFTIGDAVVLETTGICHPCSRMEENLGLGGYNAMRGHGGITARVLQGGSIQVGDQISLHMEVEDKLRK